MAEQKFGPRRCRDTRKPPADQCPDVVFYRCGECGALYVVTKGNNGKDRKTECCERMAELLLPVNGIVDSGQSQDFTVQSSVSNLITYEITGGYNDNAVRVFWKNGRPELKPEWIYLKTFTGGYLKYVMDGKRAPMVFALADTDAFAYCDEEVCLECVFRCKRGFVIYAYFKESGLVEIPIDKMTAYWQSEGKEGKVDL